MHQALINNKLYKVPSTWNELTRRQLLRLMRGALTLKPEFLTTYYLLVILGIRGSLFAAFTQVQKLSLAYLTDFLSEQPTLTDNLLPSFRLPVLKTKCFKKLYGPAANFNNLVMGEFICTETLFLAWHKTKDHKFLDLLVAILYRPKRKGYNPNSPDFKGDVREDFNPNLFEGRADKWIKHVPAHFKMAVLYYYVGCRAALMEQYPEAFSGSDEATSIPTAAPLVDMLHDLPNDKFGTIDAAEKALVHTIFYEINKVNKRQKETAK